MIPPGARVIFRAMHRAALLILAAAALACGGDSGPTDPPDLGLPIVGRFSGLVANNGTATASFIAGRSERTQVQVCGPSGTNMDILVGSIASTTPSNCEQVLFNATAGQSYTVTVTASGEGGSFAGCFSLALAPCAAPIPQRFTGDTTAPPGYYDAATGQTGTALIAALNDIIDNHRSFDYTTARDSLYAVVDDPDNDDLIVDVYTARTEVVNSRSSAAAVGFNTEHIWPRSMGAETNTAGGTDLHMLMTADETANGQRLNYPFGSVTGSVLWEGPLVNGERSRLGRDASNRIVFEPRASRRGDIARAILYWYVRYKGEQTLSLANFNVEEATILQWHAADPPDSYEIARHAVVYRVQQNRNPFIDRPQYASQIGDFPNQ